MIAHDVLTYQCARAVGFPQVSILRTPYAYQSEDPGPYNPAYRWEMREGTGPAVRAGDPYFDEHDYYAPFVRYRSPEQGKVNALEVLSLYSAEPDWGMDEGLRLSPLQVLTGGSQGYRHLRYGLFFFRVGRAHHRVLHFTRLAGAAASRRDPYWSVRFAARALHYLEDLASPMHTKPFPERAVAAGLLRPKRLYYAVYNYHLNVERAVGYRLWHGDRKLLRCIEKGEPRPVPRLGPALGEACRTARVLAGPLFSRCRELCSERMREQWVRLRVEEVERLAGDAEMERLFCAWLSGAASLVKGYIGSVALPLLASASERRGPEP